MEKLVARVCFNSISNTAKLRYEVDVLQRTHEEQAGGGGEYVDHLPRDGLLESRFAFAKHVRVTCLPGCSVLCQLHLLEKVESRTNTTEVKRARAHASSAPIKAVAKSEYQAGEERCHCK